jgi:hypothetical protein
LLTTGGPWRPNEPFSSPSTTPLGRRKNVFSTLRERENNAQVPKKTALYFAASAAYRRVRRVPNSWLIHLFQVQWLKSEGMPKKSYSLKAALVLHFIQCCAKRFKKDLAGSETPLSLHPARQKAGSSLKDL